MPVRPPTTGLRRMPKASPSPARQAKAAVRPRGGKKKSNRESAPAAAVGRAPAERYLNRELGLLEFNRRVLSYAEDPKTPLLERLRFLCIVDSNLDEFFEVRVAGLKAQIAAGSSHVE